MENLTLFILYSVYCYVIVFFARLKADKVPTLADCSDCRSSAFNAIIEYQITFVGICSYEVCVQINWLLSRVVIALTESLWNGNYRGREFAVRQLPVGCLESIVMPVRTAVLRCSVIAVMRLGFLHLRIVHWTLLIENRNVLVLTQRLSACIEEASGVNFVPYKIISPVFRLRHDNLSGKHSLAEKKDCAIRLDDSKVLFPQRLKRNLAVPVTLCDSIRQVTYNAVNAAIIYLLHTFKAVFKVYLVKFNHISFCFAPWKTTISVIR